MSQEAVDTTRTHQTLVFLKVVKFSWAFLLVLWL